MLKTIKIKVWKLSPIVLQYFQGPNYMQLKKHIL